MSPPKVLVLDDDPQVLRAASEVLRRAGHEVIAMNDPVEALTVTRDRTVDVVLTDIQMPVLDGLDVLRAFKREQPDIEVILMTGYATVPTALAAVKAGAYEYLTKPFEHIEDLSRVVARAAERRNLLRRTQTLEETLATQERFEGITGQAAAMKAVFKLVDTVSRSSATVLIQGESGTGKELVARALHFRSARKSKPFVTVNCSALTETLLESELFGHVKGSFTGALGNKKGLFEAADSGTLFLDEIGDIPQATQVRLLRALQEGEVKPVGSTESVHVDVRVIAATNADLQAAMKSGQFREDLFYRLNVINLRLPPLRERRDDIPLLAQHFLTKYAGKMEKPVHRMKPEAVEALCAYDWPGNVRELENAMERAVVLAPGEEIGAEQLNLEPAKGGVPVAAAADDPSALVHLPFADAKNRSVQAFERRYLTTMLARCGNNITQAALAAGMDRSNFRRLLKSHALAGGDRAKGEDDEG